jgi:hypothetical protein
LYGGEARDSIKTRKQTQETEGRRGLLSRRAHHQAIGATQIHMSAEAKDIEAQEPPATVHPPCEGCRHSQRCSTQNLACEAFVIFKRVGTSPMRWAAAPRQPSAATFERAHAPIRVIPRGRKRVIAEDQFED